MNEKKIARALIFAHSNISIFVYINVRVHGDKTHIVAELIPEL